MPNWKWQLHALIGFIVFSLFIVWIIADLYKKNNTLLDSRPSISVQPLKENNTYFLKVHNEGAEGLFRAQIKLIAEDPSVWGLRQYNGFWKFGNGAETKILKGQDDLFKIAELYVSSTPGTISEHLEICYFDSSANCASRVYTSTHWLGATITSQDGTTSPLDKYEYNLCVTISSSPSLREGVYHKQYKLTIDSFEPNSGYQLTSHIVGSQT